MPTHLAPEIQALLHSRATCYIATTMRDGSPQLTSSLVPPSGRWPSSATPSRVTEPSVLSV